MLEKKNDINTKFGGAFWDTLNLFIQDNDCDFIFEFVNRLPCDDCKRRFFRCIKYKSYNFNNKNKNEIRRLLWSIRCDQDPKYKDKDTTEDFNNYMKFLLIQVQE